VICTIETEDAIHFKEALKNAYYSASLEANIKLDLPLANYYNEKFEVAIWEENQIIETEVIHEY